jgi:hypothetical protein
VEHLGRLGQLARVVGTSYRRHAQRRHIRGFIYTTSDISVAEEEYPGLGFNIARYNVGGGGIKEPLERKSTQMPWSGVTRKITRAVAAILAGREDSLDLGNRRLPLNNRGYNPPLSARYLPLSMSCLRSESLLLKLDNILPIGPQEQFLQMAAICSASCLRHVAL